MTNFSGKIIAVVTGSGQGIGRAIAQRLTEDEFFVIIADVNENAGRETVHDIGESRSTFISCDVGEEESVKKVFEKIRRQHGEVGVLVNNAGIIRDKVIWKMSAAEFDEVIRVNLRGAWLMCREAAEVMRERRRGRIINIASRAWLGNPGQTNYSASKAGLVGLTRALALELAKYGVTVNAVAPGLIETALTCNLPQDVQEKLIAAQPNKSMGQPQDVAEMVAFLASGKAAFITGQVFHIDGGKSIGAGI